VKTIYTILSSLLLTTLTTPARIGETLQECRLRYGEPIQSELDEKNTGFAEYQKNDLAIELHFTKGRADLIRYNPGQIARIDMDTANYLIELNGRDKKWKQLIEEIEGIGRNRRSNDTILWETRDGMLKASFSQNRARLEIKAIVTQEYIRKGL
jgi:hypothetical protein